MSISDPTGKQWFFIASSAISRLKRSSHHSQVQHSCSALPACGQSTHVRAQERAVTTPATLWLRQKHLLTSSSEGSGQHLLYQQSRSTQGEGLIQADEIKLEIQMNSPTVAPHSSSEGGPNTDTHKPLDNTQTFTDTQLAQAMQICSFWSQVPRFIPQGWP